MGADNDLYERDFYAWTQEQSSPSLRPKLEEILSKAYGRARRYATEETGLPISTFPENCPFDSTQLLDTEFWPT